ncbi:MAG: hypothetical protein ACFFCE_09445 [Promethearchaeota archaeon]
MSKINVNSGEFKYICRENKIKAQNLSKRYCGNCKKEYLYEDVIKKYPELFKTPITTIWKNPEIKFYCSYCYLLMIIKSIKRD